MQDVHSRVPQGSLFVRRFRGKGKEKGGVESCPSTGFLVRSLSVIEGLRYNTTGCSSVQTRRGKAPSNRLNPSRGKMGSPKKLGKSAKKNSRNCSSMNAPSRNCSPCHTSSKEMEESRSSYCCRHFRVFLRMRSSHGYFAMLLHLFSSTFQNLKRNGCWFLLVLWIASSKWYKVTVILFQRLLRQYKTGVSRKEQCLRISGKISIQNISLGFSFSSERRWCKNTLKCKLVKHICRVFKLSNTGLCFRLYVSWTIMLCEALVCFSNGRIPHMQYWDRLICTSETMEGWKSTHVNSSWWIPSCCAVQWSLYWYVMSYQRVSLIR